MTDERDDLLREIGAVLAIESSPSFAARVRERIEAEPASIWSRRRVWWGIAGAGLAMTAAVALVMLLPARQQAAAVQPPVVAQGPEPAAAPSNPAAREIAPEGGPGAGVPRADTRVVRHDALKPPTLDAAPEVARRVAGPDLTVVTNQGAILRALWARTPAKPAALMAVDSTQVAPPESVAIDAAAPVPPDLVAAPIVVPEIKIEPIVFFRLDVSTPAGSPGGGSIRKVIAEESAGSRER